MTNGQIGTVKKPGYYRDACLEVGSEMNVPVVETWRTFLGETLEPKKEILDQVFCDGLHLSKIGNSKLFAALKDTILKHWPELEPESIKMYPVHWSQVDNQDLPGSIFK